MPKMQFHLTSRQVTVQSWTDNEFFQLSQYEKLICRLCTRGYGYDKGYCTETLLTLTGFNSDKVVNILKD